MNSVNLKIAFVSLSLLTSIVLILVGLIAIKRTVSDKRIAKRNTIVLIVGLLFWQLYTFVIASSGILDNFDFPPRFFLFLILPLFLFTGVFIYGNRSDRWVVSIPVHWLIFYQSLRILIESIFLASLTQGILNKEVTIEGYNFDMIFAFTAPLVGYLSWKKMVSVAFLKIWNYVGLVVIASIIFLFISSIYNPQFFGSESILLPTKAVKYPYVLVAGFLMPAAVFVHVLSLVQLSRVKQSKWQDRRMRDAD